MVKMFRKKGVSGHVEIIISFTIFIAFVTFLLIFVNPVKKTNTNTHYLEITENVIMERILINLTVFSVTLPVTATGCFCIPYIRPGTDRKLIVKNEFGDSVTAASVTGSFCINGGNRYHKIYFSEEFVEGGVSCTNILTEEAYSIGVLKKKKKISNNSLFELNRSYNLDYSTFRNELGIPGNFNIFVETLDGAYLVYGEIQEPKNSEVIAKEIPIEIINEEGESILAIMNLQVW